LSPELIFSYHYLDCLSYGVIIDHVTGEFLFSLFCRSQQLNSYVYDHQIIFNHQISLKLLDRSRLVYSDRDLQRHSYSRGNKKLRI
jgi:hypothetical protein